MKVLVFAALVAVLAPFVAADCPNACSGHGDCQSNWDYCSCYHGYLGADCSQRLCAFGLSFIDTPQGDLNHNNNLDDGFGDRTAATGIASRPFGTPTLTALNPMWRFQGWWERHPAALYGTNNQPDLPFYVHPQEGHFYAECSNRGLCNRESGLCECFTGYEGAACNRTTCNNDCSGHGICETMTEVTPDVLYYRLWDADKTQQCVCDGGYFGVDCSQRLCMGNDDPLTTKTTRQFYNDGLDEQPEIQIVDVRCPFNGEMLDPMVSLTFTDEFGDKYETAQFNPDPSVTSNAAVLAALKAVPNQALADFTVDGTTEFARVSEVNGATLETDNYYRWTVTFDSRMGDVNMLSGTPYFKCKGGAEVDWHVGSVAGAPVWWEENVAVTFFGDGPEEYLEFDFLSIDDTATDTAEYVVRNAAGEVFNNQAAVTHTFKAFLGTGAGLALDGVSAFTREAEKVGFDFSLGVGASTTDRGDDAGAIKIKIHVDPVITVKNQLFTLVDPTLTSRAITPIDRHGGDAGAVDLTVNFATGAAPTYDVKYKIESLHGTAGNLGAFYMNDEFIANIIIPQSGPLLIDEVATPTVIGGAGAVFTFPANGIDFLGTVQLGGAPELHMDYTWWLEKTPLISQAAGPETLTIAFTNYEPPAAAVPLVLQITSTSTGQDQYAWKIAGDTNWVYQVGTTTGFDIPAGAETLGRVEAYLGDLYYPDDPLNLVRSNIDVIELTWSGGIDFDERICEAEAGTNADNKYYVMIGSQGLNDAPECSDRGICDYSTGTCKCFKGYAGIDCHLQNALAPGFSSA